ncbi:DUF4249 domain-containing protein [Fibrella aquatica]|uniref:DUF4249 domain-containing protein n=1 Tax=Fibrella aquatica TaxID=3242487 RepID=UPI003522B7B8
MNNSFTKLLAYVGLLAATGCVDLYRPPEIVSPDNYLVVNGFFNSAPGTTSTIRLTRTQNLSETKAPVAETKAQVTIENQTKAVYPFTEGNAGTYTLAGVTPRVGDTYRLHIRTAKGTDYYSDYVPVVQTPPIDSLSWRVQSDGVQINLNTHDPTNNTRFYRWEYDVTWEHRAPFFAYLELKNNEIVPRAELIYQCWSTENSTSIITTSTKRLSNDVVSQFPLVFVPSTSPRLTYKYSILVRQIGLTQAGYTYYDQLGKLTQNIGSIFDPQPAQVTGNIRSTSNPADLVMGFFRVGSIETKRLFIASTQLPNWPNLPGIGDCALVDMSEAEIRRLRPAVVSFQEGTYQTSTVECIDCRLKGGTNKQPDFWK